MCGDLMEVLRSFVHICLWHSNMKFEEEEEKEMDSIDQRGEEDRFKFRTRSTSGLDEEDHLNIIQPILRPPFLILTNQTSLPSNLCWRNVGGGC